MVSDESAVAAISRRDAFARTVLLKQPTHIASGLHDASPQPSKDEGRLSVDESDNIYSAPAWTRSKSMGMETLRVCSLACNDERGVLRAPSTAAT